VKFSLPQWTRDPQGIYFGNEISLTPQQMLAFGSSIYHGTLEGRRIVAYRG
jgi:hypothetical protein